MSVERNLRLLVFCDWSRKLAPLSQPIRCNTKATFSRPLGIVVLIGSLRSFLLIGRCDYFGYGLTTVNRKALHVTSATYIHKCNNIKKRTRIKIKCGNFKTQKSDLTLAQVQVTGDEFGSTWTSTV